MFTGIPGITNIPEIQEPVFLILIELQNQIILNLKCYIVSFCINIILQQNIFTILLRFHLRKIFFFFFASSIMKNIIVFASPSQARFPVKLIC